MAKPLVVSISHQLGKAEAVNRIRNGIVYLKAKHADKIAVTEDTWTDGHLDFAVSALKQKASGSIDVEEDKVTLAVTLPLLLSMLADTARSLIQKEGTLLLEKK